jgi:hypothetical protein
VTDVDERLLDIPLDELEELMCKEHLGVWTARRRYLEMAPLHFEWCELRMSESRLCVVAPREHAKSETFTINGTAWDSIYKPGTWTYIFANSADQAGALVKRIREAVATTASWMVDGALQDTQRDITFANYSRITSAGSGKAVRGAHPDVIIGDDVLEKSTTETKKKRDSTKDWWLGTVGGMAHAGTWRSLGPDVGKRKAPRVWMPPTRVFLVGTPFHEEDLLMAMKANPLYRYRRYAAEFEPHQLVDGLAVEVA